METYYYGQGRVWSRKTGGKWRWWGDVSQLELAIETETALHKESYSGNKGTVRKMTVGKTMTLSATLHQVNSDSLADLVYGAVTTIAGGSISNEAFPSGLIVSDVVKLAHPGVSALTIVDSTTPTAATFPAGNYRADLAAGSIEILSLTPTPVQPLRASYTHAARRDVNFLTQPEPVMELRYEGINLAENNKPVIVELYRLSTEPLQQLALINDGNDLAGMQISGEVLLDTSKLATGPLGQFGRLMQVT